MCYGQISFVCVFRGFSCQLYFLRRLFVADWKSPDYSQLCRGTPGSFIDYGWCMISSPLAKLLIAGVMSRAAPPPPGRNRCTCNTPAKGSMCCSDSCFCHVRLCGLCTLVAVPTLTQGFHQAPLQSTLAAPGSSYVQETASRVASALLSAESERLAIQEGDTKSLPNHLLSPALWSNASLAKSRVPWFEHRRAVTGGPESSGTLPLFPRAVC